MPLRTQIFLKTFALLFCLPSRAVPNHCEFLFIPALQFEVHQRVLPIAERYWNHAIADTIASAIIKNRDLHFHRPFQFTMKVELDEFDQLNVAILSIATAGNVKFGGRILKSDTRRKPRGLDPTFAIVIAGIIKGLQSRIQVDRSFQSIEIQVPTVVNDTLSQLLSGLGMEQTEETAGRLRFGQLVIGAHKSYRLKLDVIRQIESTPPL